MTTIHILYRVIDYYDASIELLKATGFLPLLAIGAGVALIGWGAVEIWSAWQDRELREAKKPIVR